MDKAVDAQLGNAYTQQLENPSIYSHIGHIVELQLNESETEVTCSVHRNSST